MTTLRWMFIIYYTAGAIYFAFKLLKKEPEKITDSEREGDTVVVLIGILMCVITLGLLLEGIV